MLLLFPSLTPSLCTGPEWVPALLQAQLQLGSPLPWSWGPAGRGILSSESILFGFTSACLPGGFSARPWSIVRLFCYRPARQLPSCLSPPQLRPLQAVGARTWNRHQANLGGFQPLGTASPYPQPGLGDSQFTVPQGDIPSWSSLCVPQSWRGWGCCHCWPHQTLGPPA